MRRTVCSDLRLTFGSQYSVGMERKCLPTQKALVNGNSQVWETGVGDSCIKSDRNHLAAPTLHALTRVVLALE